jgi:DNA polymerase III alpha subunit
LTSKIPPSVKTIDEAVKITEVRTFFNKHPEIEKACRAFEGSIRGLSKHAAGILITPGALSDYVSTVKVNGEICSVLTRPKLKI